jgi:hypothetical protein
MRKLLAVAMVAAFATAANASSLRLEFSGTNADDATNATIPNPGESVTVNVFFNMTPNDAAFQGLNTIAFNLTAVPEDPAFGVQGDKVEDAGLFASGNATGVTGWLAGGADGNVGSLGHQFSVGALLQADGVQVAGDLLVGSFTVQGNALGAHTFYIQRNTNADSPAVSNFNGGGYTWSATPSDGYGQYSIGNGYAGNGNGSGAIGMNINVLPEPAALALLAMGGVAVLRRRR